MKNFNDLEFRTHPAGLGTQASMRFPNGYGVSVICGSWYYSNGVNTYELAVLKDGSVSYTTPVTDDVLRHLTEREVSDAMEEVQELPSVD